MVQRNVRQRNCKCVRWMGKGRKCKGQEHTRTRLKQPSETGKEWEGAYNYPFCTASRKNLIACVPAAKLNCKPEIQASRDGK